MNSASTAEQQNKKKRTKKQPFSLKFDSEVDFANSFAKGRVCIYPVIFLYFVCLLEFMVGKGGSFEPLRFPSFENCAGVDVDLPLSQMKVSCNLFLLRGGGGVIERWGGKGREKLESAGKCR